MKLKPTKKTIYESKVVVRGRGSFPFDMLRYDSCIPYSETDSNEMAREGGLSERTVVLRRRCVNTSSATVARWQSFGWDVVNEEPSS